jgi:Transmembrane exosortase (Exosortase_EpsH)
MVNSELKRTGSSAVEIKGDAFVPWLIALAGLVGMYSLTFWDLFHGLWAGDQQGHGPIVLAISIWLLWKNRDALATLPKQGNQYAGWSLLTFGLFLYLIGRSQDILLFEVGSIVFVTASTLLLLSRLCA